MTDVTAIAGKMAPAIHLENLGKRFDCGPWVIEAVQLSVQPGEMVALLGPSGCGKSTLLRIIAGLLPATTGQVRAECADPEPAFIFQDATLLAWADLLDNIALPLRIRGVERRERRERALYWAQQLGLADAVSYYPRQLSGGMRMRVSLARALITRPNLLLLDEPYSALDALTRNRLNDELLQLHRADPWTAFFVTHSVSEAAFVADRIILFSGKPGRICRIVTNPLPPNRDRHIRETTAFHQLVAELTRAIDEIGLPDNR